MPRTFDVAVLVGSLRQGSLTRQLALAFAKLAPASLPLDLVGLRDLKDYLVEAKGGLPPNPGSPFNIKSHSLTLRNFTRDEVAELYAQHTEDTGQVFTQQAVDRAFFWSRGQPFLVNALAYQLTREEPVPAPQAITDADIATRDKIC